MKKICFFTLFLFSIYPFFSSAQSLEFNQVVVFDMTHSTDYAFTVPSGKVWKIESASSSYTGASIQLRNSSLQNVSLIYSGVSNPRKMLPIWLPGGWSGYFRYFDSGSDRALITILEFNVVP